MQVIGFGASSMEGVGDSRGGFFRRVSELLTAERSDLSFLNLGVGGNTTRDMVARSGAVAQAGAHDVIVLLGCNDVPRNNDGRPQIRTTLDEYKENLRSLLPSVRGDYSLFISSFPVCPTRTGVQEETLAAYMTVAATIAAEYGYDVWDLFRELQGTDLTPYWAPDGLHFNDTGHAMIAARLAERLASRYAP